MVEIKVMTRVIIKRENIEFDRSIRSVTTLCDTNENKI